MSCNVYARPEPKRRAAITPEVEAVVLALLRTQSQQVVARQLGLSQSAVSRIVKRLQREVDHVRSL